MSGNPELLRLVDSIHRDKDVDKNIIFEALEAAMLSAARKQIGNRPEITVTIDRESGQINVYDDGELQDVLDLGRISAQTAKQIIIQRIREAERDVVFGDFEKRMGEIVSGVIQRYEGPSVIVNLGKTEGFLPRREQVPGENYRPGERVRALVLDVRKVGPKVRILLTRTHPDLIRRLFELEVPEINDHTIEIKALAREPGARSKIGVFSIDSKVDCVGACVGVRGTRIKNIVDELGGEKIDIVRWSDSLEMFIANALRPAEISHIHMDSQRERAVVIVGEDQLALGIGKKGQNVRLASKLVGWDIDIHTTDEFEKSKDTAKEDFAKIEGIDERLAAKLVDSGVYTLHEFADSETELLVGLEGITEENVEELQDKAVLLIRVKREEAKLAEEAKQAEEAAAAAAAAAGETPAEDAATEGEPAEASEGAPAEEPQAAEEPATEAAAETASEEPEPEAHASEETAAETPPAEDPAADEPAAEEPAAEEPAAEAEAEAQVPAAEASTDEPPAEEPAAAEAPSPTADAADESVAIEEQAAAEDPASEEPAAQAPSEEEPEVEPPAEESAEEPPSEESADDVSAEPASAAEPEAEAVHSSEEAP
ncbi:MAG: transcription termination factor NusA, partial [Planctomycetota bacterium]|nr:transcription termination factor NusA [Planctomycetota bacterium]